jgi:heparanase 1
MFGLRRQSASVPATTDIVLEHAQPVASVDRRYLSFSIDISVLAGGYWWEGDNGSRRGLGTLRVPPLNLERKKLDRLARALGPAYLRIGGSEADKIHYFDPPPGKEETLVLSRDQWDALHAFLRRNNLKLIFTAKYGLFKRRDQGTWDGKELESLLAYSVDRGYRIHVLELGNELNAYWAFHGLRSQPGPANLASDYRVFADLVKRFYPRARVSGPGSAFWPRLGETIRPFTNITPRFLHQLDFELDIVDWHYYPFQSERSPIRTRAAKVRHLIDPASFEDFARFAERLGTLRDTCQPGAELWTGETGSAQCGGQPDLSDRWASSFWWADQLGRGARVGQRVMVRQSLVGGDYGMVDRLTLKPRPDFWISWLWTRLMGKKVYAVASSDSQVRAYLHGHPSGIGATLMLVNLHGQAVSHRVRGLAVGGERYVVTARSLTSRKVFINGERPRFRKGKVSLDDFPTTASEDTLPAHSISFWRVQAPL